MYRPGVYAWSADLKDDADEFVKMGWMIVFADSGEVVPLDTPESTLRLTRRESSPALAGDSMTVLF